jgi:hypothetical protein
MSNTLDAFFRKYDRVYNPEANERALAEREAAAARKKALAEAQQGKSRNATCE